MLFANPHAERRPCDEVLRAILGLEQARECRRWLASWSGERGGRVA